MKREYEIKDGQQARPTQRSGTCKNVVLMKNDSQMCDFSRGKYQHWFTKLERLTSDDARVEIDG